MFDLRERHFSVSDLAAIWNLGPDLIRRLFQDEPGVIVISTPRRRTRVYRVLRIPESVANAVYQRLKNGGRR